jgi:hypothetical protein
VGGLCLLCVVCVYYESNLVGWGRGGAEWFINMMGFTIPDSTSEGLSRRVHFCVPAHKNRNHKSVCLERGRFGKIGFGKGSG